MWDMITIELTKFHIERNKEMKDAARILYGYPRITVEEAMAQYHRIRNNSISNSRKERLTPPDSSDLADEAKSDEGTL